MIVEDKYYVSNYEEKQTLISLSPSSKFILYILKQRGPLSQKEILQKTLLPKRTAAYSLRKLLDYHVIKKKKNRKSILINFLRIKSIVMK